MALRVVKLGQSSGQRTRSGQTRPRLFAHRFKRGNFKRVARKAVAKARKDNFKSKVLNVMNSQLERKMKTWNVANGVPIKGTGLALGTDGTTRCGAFQSLLDISAGQIAQGTANDQRIGNAIGNVKLSLRGVIYSNVYNASSNNQHVPFEVWLLAFKEKNNKSYNPDKLKIAPGAVGETELTGEGLNSVRPWNKKSYVIKKVRMFKMRCHPEHTAPGATTPLLNANTSDAGYRLSQRFSMTIPIAKHLKYDDNSNIPTNDWCHFCLYVVNSDGHGLDSTMARARCSIDACLTYSDA